MYRVLHAARDGRYHCMFFAFPSSFLTLSCIVCVALPSFPCVGYYLRCLVGFRRKNHNHQVFYVRYYWVECASISSLVSVTDRHDDDDVFGAMAFVACLDDNQRAVVECRPSRYSLKGQSRFLRRQVSSLYTIDRALFDMVFDIKQRFYGVQDLLYRSIYIYVSIYLSMHLNVYPSIYLSIYLSAVELSHSAAASSHYTGPGTKGQYPERNSISGHAHTRRC